ncbi:MAG: HAMP domain-containing histidine kinase [Myxococcales bacterium]|nr:HAMP domain-containing histidine kinase [Myxococcales bacterium]
MAYQATRRGYEDELGQRLSSVAATVAAQLSTSRDAGRIARLDPSMPGAVSERLNQWLEALRQETDARRMFVFNPELVSLLDTEAGVTPGNPLYELEPDRNELGRIVSGDLTNAHSVLFSSEDGTRFMNGYAPVYYEGELIAFVGVAGSASFFEQLDRTAAVLSGLAVLVVLLVLVVSFVVSHRLTRPIGELVDALQRYGSGRLREPLPITSRDEIGFMAQAFNDMRNRIDRRDEQMQLMLSGIAHEVRNPLAGMELFCGLLRDELGEGDEARSHVDKISKELEYLSRVVNDFLAYARRRPLSPERFLAADMLGDLKQSLVETASKRGVALRFDIPSGVELSGEREAIRGLVHNLVQNAVQACTEGQSVDVRVSVEGSNRIIRVSDTGRGMDEEQASKAFEPFYTTRQKGTGLGLALAHKTVQEHRGEIKLETILGQGTTFTVVLPFDSKLSPLVHEPDFAEDDGEMEMIG